VVEWCGHRIEGIPVPDADGRPRARFAHSNGAWLEGAYTGWHRGKCLIHFSLTHSHQHVGEIGVLASL